MGDVRDRVRWFGLVEREVTGHTHGGVRGRVER